MLKPSDLIGRQVLGTAGMLGALLRTPQILGTVAHLAALGGSRLAPGGRGPWSLVAPGERLGAIRAIIEHLNAQRETAAPTIEHHPAPVRVFADHDQRNRTERH